MVVKETSRLRDSDLRTKGRLANLTRAQTCCAQQRNSGPRLNLMVDKMVLLPYYLAYYYASSTVFACVVREAIHCRIKSRKVSSSVTVPACSLIHIMAEPNGL